VEIRGDDRAARRGRVPLSVFKKVLALRFEVRELQAARSLIESQEPVLESK
jgi:hypothetical protein